MKRAMRVVMGTRLSIALEAPPGKDADALLGEAFAIVATLDRLLSNYRRDSALSRLNRRALRGTVPEALLGFLGAAARYCRQTEGAFDLTVGTLSRAAWRRRVGTALPSSGSVGCAALIVNRNGKVTLGPGTVLDSGGLGKGYAVDAVVSLLRRRHVERAFIDFGGSSFYGLGTPRGAPGWLVAIGRAGSAGAGRVVLLRDRALSSSESLGRGRPHIIDPRSGKLLREPRLAAVVSPSATDAEALSTALVVDPRLRPKLKLRFPSARLIRGRRALHRSCRPAFFPCTRSPTDNRS